jgi:YidC/Oxa1 family membrane protein insertase
MERRFFLALVLTGVVVVLTPRLFPAPPKAITASVDSTSVAVGSTPATTTTGATAASQATGASTTGAAPRTAATAGATAQTVPAAVPAETLTVETPLARTAYSSIGAAPLYVQVDSYPALNAATGGVRIKHGTQALLRYRVISATDTIRLDAMTFSAQRGTATNGDPMVTFTSTTPSARGPVTATISYLMSRDSYVSTTVVRLTGVPESAFLLVDLPRGFDIQEADSSGDLRALSYAVKPVNKSAKGTLFAKLEEGETKLEPGPLTWAVAKNKYFMVGLLTPEKGGNPFSEVNLVGGAREKKEARVGQATVVMPLKAGAATFELFAGPQSWEHLRKMGREFETANPYGGFMQPVVQPFSTIVMRILLWMKKVLGLNYGWVLVIFGVTIRIVLWPLNASAMRASLRMQRLQPELTAVQAKYKSDPQKQQAEIMRIYKDHGMSPLSPLTGCLPALIPMPVLMALFFVFQNTIEFRGVSFLWLHDISLHDPLYILPLLMGISMYVLSWIGLRNMPDNPQAKMMSWMMPLMFTFFLLQSAAGLSLYYTVQQIAALPQQWMIANERAKAKATS